MNLKEQLKELANNNYQFTQTNDKNTMIDGMLEHIGSLDSELRDDLIYLSFSNLVRNNQLSVEKMKWITGKILDNDHLFYRIRDKDDKSVYTRTFSVLIVAALLAKHREAALFTQSELENILLKVKEYCLLENDYHGYSDSYGWAHSTAHTADALDELAMCRELDEKGLLLILDMVKLKVCIGEYAYIHEEDERLVTAVMSVFERDEIVLSHIQQWIISYGEVKALSDPMKNYRMQLNIKSFLRSMYFRVINDDSKKNLHEVIHQVLSGNGGV